MTLPDKRRRQILDDEPEEAQRFDTRPSGDTSAPRNNRVPEDMWVTGLWDALRRSFAMSMRAGNEARLVLPKSRKCKAFPAAPRSRLALQFAVLPVLVFGLAEALSTVLGVSGLRTLPQGSAGALASGIFFSEFW